MPYNNVGHLITRTITITLGLFFVEPEDDSRKPKHVAQR